MVAFVVGRAVRTAEPTVTVDAGLAIGVHRFQLEVVAADGRRSAADIVEVSVLRLRIPDPLQPVVRPDLVDPVTGPVVNPVTNPVITPVITPVPTPGRIDPGTLRPGAAPRADAAPAGRPRGTRKRGPRKPAPEAPPDVSSSVSSEAPAAGRQARNTRRSKK